MLRPGDLILIDSSKPSKFKFFGEFQRQLSLHLPRKEICERFANLIHGGMFSSQTDQTAMALSAVVSKAFMPGSNEIQSGYLREALFGLLGAMLCEQANETNGSMIDADVSRAQTLKRGLAVINVSFTDNEFAIPQIAERLGISMRKLQRSFALIGTTPTDYLIHKRPEHACQLLRARRSKQGTQLVSTIAYASGVNDV